MFDLNAVIQTVSIAALPVLFAITLHEAAHAYVARYFGDPTAEQMGRISLNPLRHIDPVGTILIPAMILLLSGAKFMFGYAKPVPVNFGRLRHPKQDMFWVALAGPAANLFMALCWALLYRIAVWELPPNAFTSPLTRMSEIGVMINCVLCVLNLLPLPPLDGGRIVVSLLPRQLAWQFARIEPWGFVILLALLFIPIHDASILSAIIEPPAIALKDLIFSLVRP
ncbi:MAG: site-2 protease family protein [Azonexus sp.]|jgi:Zn-dependent protease|nr:site-2 protease family protein [Azonexus sp.]